VLPRHLGWTSVWIYLLTTLHSHLLRGSTWQQWEIRMF